MKFLKWTVLGAVGLYLAALILIFILQRNYVYFPDTSSAPQGFETTHGVETVSVHVEGLAPLHSLYSPAPQHGPIILYFHGNGNSVYSRTLQFRDFKSWNVGFLSVEYPGYGGNPGTPNQTDIFKTALANYDLLIAKGYAPEQIVLYGNSLGTTSATYVASQREGAVLILTAPFLSALAMGKMQMPYFPISLLLKDTYRSDVFMPNITEPLLIIHGDADELIPLAMGKQLFDLHAGEKNFVTIEGGKHYMWKSHMPEHIHAAIKKYVPR